MHNLLVIVALSGIKTLMISKTLTNLLTHRIAPIGGQETIKKEKSVRKL